MSKLLRQRLYQEMEAICDPLSEGRCIEFLEEIMLVAIGMYEDVVGSETALAYAHELYRFVLTSPTLEGARAMAERDAIGATIQ